MAATENQIDNLVSLLDGYVALVDRVGNDAAAQLFAFQLVGAAGLVDVQDDDFGVVVQVFLQIQGIVGIGGLGLGLGVGDGSGFIALSVGLSQGHLGFTSGPNPQGSSEPGTCFPWEDGGRVKRPKQGGDGCSSLEIVVSPRKRATRKRH